MNDASRATAEGTAEYRSRFEGKAHRDHFRTALNLTLTSVGIGTYLGPHDGETDRRYGEAITESLHLGCNHIDTASNYRCMRSEKEIGSALAVLFEGGALRREEVFIATKGGYIPFEGEPPLSIRTYIQTRYVETGIVDPDDLVGGCHALTPRFLEKQIDKSLENLSVDTIDLYYLHNPEVHAAVCSREEFHDRMRRAFVFLEGMVEAGKIARYGISSWEAFRAEPSSPVHISIEDLVALAREAAGGEHHLAAVQLPFNVAMMEGFALLSQELDGKPVSAIDAATRLGLMVVAAAPFLQAKLLENFPDFLVKGMKNLESNALRAIQFARSIPGITTVLVGMSDRLHVAENLSIARHPALTQDELFALFEG